MNSFKFTRRLALLILIGSTVAMFFAPDKQTDLILTLGWLVGINLLFLPDIFVSLYRGDYMGIMRWSKKFMLFAAAIQATPIYDTDFDKAPKAFLWLICISALIIIIAIHILILGSLLNKGIINL